MTMTKSPVSTCGVNCGLFLPRRMWAALAATLPSTWSAASITTHSRSTPEALRNTSSRFLQIRLFWFVARFTKLFGFYAKPTVQNLDTFALSRAFEQRLAGFLKANFAEYKRTLPPSMEKDVSTRYSGSLTKSRQIGEILKTMRFDGLRSTRIHT